MGNLLYVHDKRQVLTAKLAAGRSGSNANTGWESGYSRPVKHLRFNRDKTLLQTNVLRVGDGNLDQM